MINIKFSNYISNILNYNLNTSFPKRFKERVKDWLCSDGDFFKYIDKSDGMDELFYDDVENIDNEIFFVNNLREIKDEYFYFINDEFQCSFFTTELRNNCNTLTEVFPRKRFYLTKNSC